MTIRDDGGGKKPKGAARRKALGEPRADFDAPVADEQSLDWRTPEQRKRDIAQAQALRARAVKGGLRFEVLLPPGLAEWVLDFVARGVFVDPSEAVFVMLAEQKDLEPHRDLRDEILKRSFQASLDETDSLRAMDEATEAGRERVLAGQSEPAVWVKKKYL